MKASTATTVIIGIQTTCKAASKNTVKNSNLPNLLLMFTSMEYVKNFVTIGAGIFMLIGMFLASRLILLYAKKDIRFKNQKINFGIYSADAEEAKKQIEQDKRIEDLSQRIVSLEQQIKQSVKIDLITQFIVLIIALYIYLIYYKSKENASPESEKHS